MKKFLPALVCGFGAAVLSIVPAVKALSCCLFVPVAGGMAVYLYNRTTPSPDKLNVQTILLIGLFTGLVAAFFTTAFDLILTYTARTNDFVKYLPESEAAMRELGFGAAMEQTIKIFRNIAADIEKTGFSSVYAGIMLFSNLIIDTIFALLGAFVGMTLINKQKHQDN